MGEEAESEEYIEEDKRNSSETDNNWEEPIY